MGMGPAIILDELLVVLGCSHLSLLCDSFKVDGSKVDGGGGGSEGVGSGKGEIVMSDGRRGRGRGCDEEPGSLGCGGVTCLVDGFFTRKWCWNRWQ